MYIRKIKSTKNEYVFAGNCWVRNFTQLGVNPVDLSNLSRPEDQRMMVANELVNDTLGAANIADENFHFSKVLIVSDGYDFEKRHLFTSQLSDVAVIAINGALRKWTLYGHGKTQAKAINLYVVNNPYAECMYYMPTNYFPTCLLSARTYPQFAQQYHGMKYVYAPTPSPGFGVQTAKVRYTVDDYRNPICAALVMAYRLQASKIMLLCCDDSFDGERPGSAKLTNGLWTYPQHLRTHDIIDANLFWLTERTAVQVADYSLGGEYEHAVYIKSDEEAINFFRDDTKGGQLT